MASSYPSTYDSTAGPSASDKTNSVTYPHATLHTDSIARAVALQHRVGLSTSGLTGSSYPSTRIGESLGVESTAGHTAWGLHSPVKLAEAISTSTGVSALDFTGIPDHFSHLQILYSGRGESTVSAVATLLQLGGAGAIDTSTAYEHTAITGQAGVVAQTAFANSTRIPMVNTPGSTGPAGRFSRLRITIFEYSNTGMHKGVIADGFSPGSIPTSTTEPISHIFGGNWQSTAKVTNARLFMNTGNFAVGAKASLWGLP